MNKTKNYQGFSLFESLIVLLIVSIISFIPVLKYTQWQEQRHVSRQLNQFERLYEKAQQYAVITDIRSDIVVDSTKQMISFSYFYYGRQYTEYQKLNGGLSLSAGNKEELHLLGSTGRPSKLMTFTFIDSVSQRKIQYKVQMTNSKVMRYEESI